MSEAQASLLTPETRRYLANSYPHNHNYRIFGNRLWPGWQLYLRSRRITALYPRNLESLVDLAVSKGYFAVNAAIRSGKPRVLGIDVNREELAAAASIAGHLGLSNIRLEALRLHELAANIADYGGSFQTALLINVYQYLYFGSGMMRDYYDSHTEIFRALRTVCHDSLIFSNCVDFDRLPTGVQRTARAQDRHRSYSTDKIRNAAEEFFRVEEHGTLGRRPLWRLTPQ